MVPSGTILFLKKIYFINFFGRIKVYKIGNLNCGILYCYKRNGIFLKDRKLVAVSIQNFPDGYFEEGKPYYCCYDKYTMIMSIPVF